MTSNDRAPRQTNPIEHDVTIVGAGPVGLLLANLLGRRGIQTRIFDKRTEPPASSMAIGITPPSLEILKHLGLDHMFREAGVQVRHAEVYEAHTCIGRLDFAGIASEYPFFLSLPQARTVEILRANLANCPSVSIRDGVAFKGLSHSAHTVRATFHDTADGTAIETQSRFLIGADGHRSMVRAAAGMRVREKVYPQRFIMADFKDDTSLGSEGRLFFTPEASVESFPLPEGFRRWIVLMDESQVDEPGNYLIEKVQRLTGYCLGDQPARFVSTFGAKRMIVNSYHTGRVILAGDAAHVMSSIGGQGMNTGFADAEMLAEILPAVLKSPSRMEPCLARYDRIRRQSFEVAATRAERGMWLGTMRGRAASWCRKHFIRDVLFSRFMAHHLAPHFAMLTIPHRNLNWVPRDWLATD